MTDDKKKLQLVDLTGIDNLLEHLMAEDAISCEERDRTIQRVAKDNGFDVSCFLSLQDLGETKKKSWKDSTNNKLLVNLPCG